MPGITHEANQMRRSHRVTIPLYIRLGQTLYTTNDWSMTGVGIKGVETTYTHDEIVESSLLLQFTEARLEIPVKLQFKNSRNDIAGFEFVSLGESNRKVLREYLELSIEGRLQNTDGILGIYNEPIVETPVKESVMLSDAEAGILERAFQKRVRLYTIVGTLFVFLILTTIYYNTQYVYRSIGVISGNFIKISPAVSGKMSDLHVSIGDSVSEGALLFELDERMTVDKIEIIDQKLLLLGPAQPQPEPSSDALRAMLQQERNTLDKRLRQTKMLVDQRLLTQAELDRAQDALLKADIRLEQERQRDGGGESQSKALLALKTELELRRAELINELGYRRVFAPVSGKVYAIKSSIGNYVGSSDEVMVLQTKNAPFVVCKLLKEETVDIYSGMAARIYVPSLDQTFDATVEAIGNLAINTQSMLSDEVSLKEITVKLRFSAPLHDGQLNERVKVWFSRPLFG
ncbi:MAG: HlyD family efflux transporter periplasmic adaptor subunit [Campylobacterales bacterium]|nr:HlyD family efflux transporter periplasmic adaptor subunit [Campylobacterales bacterium]